MGDELLHADGQTDMTKLTVAFHNFAKPLKNAKGSFHCTDSAIAGSQQEFSHSCLVAGCCNTVL